ncbi:hypothetical protein Taro_031357 [Colocasia esculenta]|uniref:Uncharacterized protein n=1 Tax=Colocasia esculenta TaxID=4460 RepID=A0A843VRQ3_COLES|nr:hypothetical protein [Colocasia esculenta]
MVQKLGRIGIGSAESARFWASRSEPGVGRTVAESSVAQYGTMRTVPILTTPTPGFPLPVANLAPPSLLPLPCCAANPTPHPPYSPSLLHGESHPTPLLSYGYITKQKRTDSDGESGKELVAYNISLHFHGFEKGFLGCYIRQPCLLLLPHHFKYLCTVGAGLEKDLLGVRRAVDLPEGLGASLQSLRVEAIGVGTKFGEERRRRRGSIHCCCRCCCSSSSSQRRPAPDGAQRRGHCPASEREKDRGRTVGAGQGSMAAVVEARAPQQGPPPR